MDYTEVRLYTDQDSLDLLSCILTDMGIGVIVEDPRDIEDLIHKKQDYEWDYIDKSFLVTAKNTPCILFYLEDTLEGLEKMEDIFREIEILPIEKVEIKSVCDEDWKNLWKKYFKPVKISDRIVVKPTWEAYVAQKGDLVIEIDPGMAFGTGSHPTTTLCIKLLEKYLVPGQGQVLDIGCGSGILSIGAALLGAKDVLGVDIDPLACRVAEDNVKQNGFEKVIQIIKGDLTQGLDYIANITVANLMADLVMQLSKDIGKHLVKNGIYISSGILIEKQQQVVSKIKDSGFEILEIAEEDEWCAVAAKKS